MLLAALERPDGESGALRPTAMPGLKPAGRVARRRSGARSRKRRARGYGRRRMAPTARQVHAVARCPRLRTPLAGGTVGAPAR